MNVLAPFIFGRIASGADFTDRETETELLITNFLNGINTILISPRRWGKSSLVLRAAEKAGKKDKKLKFCFIDLYNVRTEEEFYSVFASAVLKATSSKTDEVVNYLRKFLANLIPKLSLSPSPDTDFSVTVDWAEVQKQPSEILDLAEKIAKEKKISMVICFDEFQNISVFSDPLGLQKKLRSHWQMHQNVSYCLYGSKKQMMMEVFTNASMPFYKFGQLIFLQKIGEKDWVKFLRKRFRTTGKSIDEETAADLARFAEFHPYYVQQLAQQSWLRTENNCGKQILNDALESLVMQLSMLFQTITDDLSSTQVNFLHALLMGVEQLSSKETLRLYKLGTSANVNRIKQALINKEIIDITGDKIELLDPMYKFWLKRYYFKLKS